MVVKLILLDTQADLILSGVRNSGRIDLTRAEYLALDGVCRQIREQKKRLAVVRRFTPKRSKRPSPSSDQRDGTDQ